MSNVEGWKYANKTVVFKETNGLSKIETNVEYQLLPWTYCFSYAYKICKNGEVIARHFMEQIDELLDSGKGVVVC